MSLVARSTYARMRAVAECAYAEHGVTKHMTRHAVHVSTAEGYSTIQEIPLNTFYE